MISTQLINGRAVARTIMAETAERLRALGGTPGLAIVLVGNDPASELYVRVKERACRRLGIRFDLHRLPVHALQPQVIALIRTLNADPAVHGIVVQLPLPSHLSEDAVIREMDWRKDADGFHPINVTNLLQGKAVEPPSLVRGIVALIRSTRTKLKGKRAAILANADVFTKPLAYVLEEAGMDVVTVKSGDPYRPATQQADVVIIAYGQPNLLKGRDIKPGSALIDVGITRLPDGAVQGDVDAESVNTVAGFLTPVPGGVGPVTVAALIESVVHAYAFQTGKGDKAGAAL